jgi:transglutaminase-like putative cysteine protease
VSAFAQPGRRTHASARRTAPLLAPGPARLATFAPLAAFGAAQWGGLVSPGAQDRLLLCVLAALGAGALLLAVGAPVAGRGRAARAALVGATALALLVVSLLVAGVPGRLLELRAWDDLAGGIAQGLGAVPTARIPFRGADEWTRIVLLVGGGLLVAAAALVAFAPRRDGALRGPLPGAVALGALYTIAAVQVPSELPWLEGALFALLLCAFLWLERVERDALGVAAGLVGVAAVAGLVVAPRVDVDGPVLDYEGLAQSLSGGPTSSFSWSHDYGPLDWPRDGREVLRVQSRRALYWKAENLTDFDGLRWRTGLFRSPSGPDVDPRVPRSGLERIRVTIRALTSREFIAAGSTRGILFSPRTPVPSSPGTYRTGPRPLRRGHAYQAFLYAPDAGERELRRADPPYPGRESGVDLGRYLRMSLPVSAGGPPGAPATLAFGAWGSDGGVQSRRGHLLDVRDGEEVVLGSAYARTYRLAQELKRDADDPYEYVERVLGHLQRSYGYTEAPPRRRVPIDAFLFEDRVGYCQQFSGAMALLLRMGGVPARVATGFSPGTFDRERREFVVRDLDAHSWVEAYFPRIGWVTFDPTPASAPATGAASLNTRPIEARPQRGGVSETDRASDQAFGGQAPSAGDGGPPWLLLAALGAVPLAAAGGVVTLRRRHGHVRTGEPALDELRRALRRAGRPLRPGATLEGVASALQGTGGERYVRALLAARYGFGRPPTRRQRADLRRALGAGDGLLGRARAWWALPPRP